MPKARKHADPLHVHRRGIELGRSHAALAHGLSRGGDFPDPVHCDHSVCSAERSNLAPGMCSSLSGLDFTLLRDRFEVNQFLDFWPVRSLK